MRPACIPASSTRRSCLKRLGRARMSAAPQPQPQPGLRTTARSAGEPQQHRSSEARSHCGTVEQNTLIEILPKQCTNSRRIGSGQQVCPEVFRANRIRFFLLVGFALIVPTNGHRKGEPCDEAEQCQTRRRNDTRSFRTPSCSSGCFLRKKAPTYAESHNVKKERAKAATGYRNGLVICWSSVSSADHFTPHSGETSEVVSKTRPAKCTQLD